MKILENLPRHGSVIRKSVVTWGVFDGVHLGHVSVLNEVIARARSAEAVSVAITFLGHPEWVLFGREVPLLCSNRQRLRWIDSLGLDCCIPIPFDERLAEQTADDFIERTLVRDLKASLVVVGYDTVFGKGAEGDYDLLVKRGSEFGFDVIQVPPVYLDGEIASSTSIRNALSRGKVETAAKLLGRPYTLDGRVVEGDRRGRSIGFPTANLDVGRQILPKNGVYCGAAVLEEGAVPAVMNVGIRPTFREGKMPLCEVHLLDFEGDLYGRRIEVEVHRRLRDEKKFAAPDDLRAQIARDIETARMLSINA